ncbi:40980_t:CDS:2, partial [Gigaspora margarita]
CSISNTTSPPSNEMSEYANFASTREALKTIFSQASDKEITIYEKQLDGVKNLDPILIISPNQAWINQQGLPAYYTVMDGFATNGLQNRRRDKNSRCVFHFADIAELYTTRDNIYNLFPNAFYDSPSRQAQLPNARLQPIGTAWILTKVGVRKSDFGPKSSENKEIDEFLDFKSMDRKKGTDKLRQELFNTSLELSSQDHSISKNLKPGQIEISETARPEKFEGMDGFVKCIANSFDINEVSQHLAQLCDTAISTEDRASKANQEEIMCWFLYEIINHGSESQISNYSSLEIMPEVSSEDK